MRALVVDVQAVIVWLRLGEQIRGLSCVSSLPLDDGTNQRQEHVLLNCILREPSDPVSLPTLPPALDRRHTPNASAQRQSPVALSLFALSSVAAEFARQGIVSEKGFKLAMRGKFVGNVFHLVRAGLKVDEGFAQRTEFAEVAAKECELHLQLEPANIIGWNFPGKTFHRCGVVLDKGDPVAHIYLIGEQGSLSAAIRRLVFWHRQNGPDS